MSRVRVLQILDSTRIGGAQYLAAHLTLALDAERFDARLLTLFGPQTTPIEALFAECPERLIQLGKHRGFDPRIFWRLDRYVREFAPQVIHTHVGALRYALPAMITRRVPVKVYTVHSLAERDAFLPWINRLAFKVGVQPVAIAAEVAASISSYYGIRAVPCIPNGIPVAYYRTPTRPRSAWRAVAGFDEQAFLLVNVSRLSPEKNHPLMLQAFAQLGPRSGPAHLLLVGEGPQRGILERQVRSLNLAARVHFLGARADIPDILGATDLFLLSSDFEGNPLCIMEAMAAGRAVVSTAVGGIPELVTDGESGLLVAAGDAAGLSAAMVRLMEDAELRRTCEQAAAAHAERAFDVKAMARAYASLYLAGSG